MTIHYTDDQVTLHHGDALDVLRALPDASVDSVVTDPPYGLAELPTATVTAALTAWLTDDRAHVPDGRGFMGNDWDRFVPPPALWDECRRVLKSGGYLLAFCAPRTVDLLTMSIRLADFEIRDGIDWLYGQGFPKSLDVSKAIDKMAPRTGMFEGFARHYAARRQASGLTHAAVCAAGQFHGATNHGGASVNWERGYGVPTREQWNTLAPLLALSDEWLPLIERVEAEREVVGAGGNGIAGGTGRHAGADGAYGFGATFNLTAPATGDAQRWQGWGTALKPAREPIVMARKPLAGTVASNLLRHGTGALNVDACRVPMSAADRSQIERMGGYGRSGYERDPGTAAHFMQGTPIASASIAHDAGRWPTNVVLSHAGSDVDGGLCANGCEPGCPAAELDAQSGVTTSGSRKAGTYGLMGYMGADAAPMPAVAGDSGGASRFFPAFRYEAKAPTSERPKVDGEAHATVKPLSLMRWLVQLVTPPGGTVLEPFAGSGTTIEACLLENFRCIAVEREAKYLPLIMARISKPLTPTLFGEFLGGAA